MRPSLLFFFSSFSIQGSSDPLFLLRPLAENETLIPFEKGKFDRLFRFLANLSLVKSPTQRGLALHANSLLQPRPNKR